MPVRWLLPPCEISNRRSAAVGRSVILIGVIASVSEAIQCHQEHISSQAAARLVGRERVPNRCRSKSGLHPSHGLRVYSVVLAVGAEEANRYGSCPILQGRNQTIVIALDVEDDPAGNPHPAASLKRGPGRYS